MRRSVYRSTGLKDDESQPRDWTLAGDKSLQLTHSQSDREQEINGKGQVNANPKLADR